MIPIPSKVAVASRIAKREEIKSGMVWMVKRESVKGDKWDKLDSLTGIRLLFHLIYCEAYYQQSTNSLIQKVLMDSHERATSWHSET